MASSEAIGILGQPKRIAFSHWHPVRADRSSSALLEIIRLRILKALGTIGSTAPSNRSLLSRH
jgi:hypothetical protein